MSGDGDWTSNRCKVSYEEARHVLQAQNETMTDIDDKAMRTVRLAAVLLGILLTAVQVDAGAFDRSMLGLAVVALVGSGIFGIVTYDESGLLIGPNGDYLETLAFGEWTEATWDEEFLSTYAGMISENHTTLQNNAHLLTASQTPLIVGIVASVVSLGI